MTTEVFCDREFDTEGTSSVIEAVYYSTEEQKLFVVLIDGDVIAGYADVPEEIFDALNILNSYRLVGDKKSSVGSYWNRFVRGNFSGIEMDDIDIVTQSDLDKRAWIEAEKKTNAAGTVKAPHATILPVNPPQQLHNFVVTLENTALSVLATDYKQAIKKVHEAAGILGWEPVKVLSVTLYLEN